MSSPRSGFRRAAIASWLLAGIGVAGVAGASQLAYAGTLKPVAEEQPAEEQPAAAAIPAPPAAPVDVPAPPAASPSKPPAAQPAPEPIVAAPPAPVRQAPVPVYTPPPTYAPAPQYTPPPAPAYVSPAAPVYVAPPAPVYVAPAPVQQAPVAAPAPSQGGFPIRHSNTGSGGGGSVSSGNKFTPPHTASRGS